MASKEEIIEGFKKAVIEGDLEEAKKWAEEAVKAGLDAYEVITQGGAKAMEVVNELYEKREYFVPEVLCSAVALQAGVDILRPHIKVEKTRVPAKVILGVVEGDIHDIGKNLVKIMLSAAGFEVIDLGKDVPLQKFIEAIKEHNAELLGMSALMSTTMPGMKKVIEMLAQEGIRNKIKIMVGGGPVTPEWAKSIGADARPKDAAEAIDVAKRLVEELREKRS